VAYGTFCALFEKKHLPSRAYFFRACHRSYMLPTSKKMNFCAHEAQKKLFARLIHILYLDLVRIAKNKINTINCGLCE